MQLRELLKDLARGQTLEQVHDFAQVLFLAQFQEEVDVVYHCAQGQEPDPFVLSRLPQEALHGLLDVSLGQPFALPCSEPHMIDLRFHGPLCHTLQGVVFELYAPNSQNLQMADLIMKGENTIDSHEVLQIESLSYLLKDVHESLVFFAAPVTLRELSGHV